MGTIASPMTKVNLRPCVAPPQDWPEFDLEHDCYWMAGPNGLPIYGDSVDNCLSHRADALRLHRKNQEQETSRFCVAQQISFARYQIHIFASELHFKAWMLAYHTGNMRPASQAKGSRQAEVNHINELDFAVSDKLAELSEVQP